MVNTFLSLSCEHSLRCSLCEIREICVRQKESTRLDSAFGLHKPCLSPREPLRPLAVTPVKRGLYMSNDVKMARLVAGVGFFYKILSYHNFSVHLRG